jgi:hypothetical protein
MKKTIIKNYEFKGFGFPVVFDRMEMRQVLDGETVPLFNMRVVQDMVFEALVHYPAQMSGNHLAFVRKYMGLTQKEFAYMIGLSTHGRISTWEKTETSPAGMAPPHEANVRAVMRKWRKESSLPLDEHLQLLNGLAPTTIPLQLKSDVA